ncbi:MAG: ABC transporter permease [Acidimicrobiia bacterium]|nr:ABC transporter permease [Acidimicrobiia bacterium]
MSLQVQRWDRSRRRAHPTLPVARIVVGIAAAAVILSSFAARPPIALVGAALATLGATLLPRRARTAIVHGLPRALLGVVAATMAVSLAMDSLPNNVDPTTRLPDWAMLRSYFEWLALAVGGDLGVSRGIGEPVLDALQRTLPVTLLLVLYSQMLALGIGVPAAMWAAAREGGWFDRLSSSGASALVSMPVFVSAIVVQIFFVVGPVQIGPVPIGGKWLPAVRYVTPGDGIVAHLRSMALPTVTLAASILPTYLRTLRAEVLGVLREDFITAVRSRGLPRRTVLFRHVLPSSTTSVVSTVAANTGVLIGYVFIVDVMFSRPGLGDYLEIAVARRDRPAVLGVVLATTLVVTLVNLFADAAQLAIDPRIPAPAGGILNLRRPRRGSRSGASSD